MTQSRPLFVTGVYCRFESPGISEVYPQLGVDVGLVLQLSVHTECTQCLLHTDHILLVGEVLCVHADHVFLTA